QIIPVRCFSCGKVIGDKWNAYLVLLSEDSTNPYENLTELTTHSTHSCCRRMVLIHVDLIENLLHYNCACLPFSSPRLSSVWVMRL
ncbi:hypothetical protein PILCRDRAFT_65564, partial [Piloderma croceum F 1598]